MKQFCCFYFVFLNLWKNAALQAKPPSVSQEWITSASEGHLNESNRCWKQWGTPQRRCQPTKPPDLALHYPRTRKHRQGSTVHGACAGHTAAALGPLEQRSYWDCNHSCSVISGKQRITAIILHPLGELNYKVPPCLRVHKDNFATCSVLWPASCSPTHPSSAGWEAGCWNGEQVWAEEPNTATQLNKQLSSVNIANAEAPRLCTLHTSYSSVPQEAQHSSLCTLVSLRVDTSLDTWQDSSPTEVGEWSN